MGIKAKLAGFKVRSWLISGFGLTAAMLAVTVAVNLRQVDVSGALTEQMVQQRLPSTMAGSRLVSNVQASTAALRDWMLTGNADNKTRRAAIWQEVDQDRQSLDKLAQNWDSAADKADWEKVKGLLDTFRASQEATEAVAHSDQEQPALAMLAKDAAQPEAIVTGGLGAMMNEELTQESTDDRKALFVALAELRQAFALSMSSIRANAMTGDAKFVADFEKNWTIVQIRLSKIDTLSALFTKGQNVTFGMLKMAADKLNALLPQVEKIRASDQWNLAQSKLKSDVAPASDALLDLLSGKPGANGERHGGLVDRQADSLSQGGGRVIAASHLLEIVTSALGLGGIAISVVIALVVIRALTAPISRLTDAMGRLAKGDLGVEVPDADLKNEMGAMARALAVF